MHTAITSLIFAVSLVIFIPVNAYQFKADYVLKKFYAHYQTSPPMYVIESTTLIPQGAYDSIPHEIREKTYVNGSALTYTEAPEHLQGKQVLVKNNDRSLSSLNDVIIRRDQFYEPILNSLITRKNGREALVFLNGLRMKLLQKAFPVRERSPIPEDLEVYLAIGEHKRNASQKIELWFDRTNFLLVKAVLENDRNERFIEYYRNYTRFKIYPQEIEIASNGKTLLTYTVTSFRNEVIDEARFSLTPFISFPSQKISLSLIDKKDTVALYTHRVKTRYLLQK